MNKKILLSLILLTTQTVAWAQFAPISKDDFTQQLEQKLTNAQQNYIKVYQDKYSEVFSKNIEVMNAPADNYGPSLDQPLMAAQPSTQQMRIQSAPSAPAQNNYNHNIFNSNANNSSKQNIFR